MAATTLTVLPRAVEGSRSTRRLRRAGQVPGILYGGGVEATPFSVDARELRQALHARGAVLDVQLDGKGTPAILKDSQYHPVRGETMHVDLLRVNLSIAIEAIVALVLTGAEEAPGTKDGGVLEQVARELHISALPNAIPESIELDVSTMEINDTLTLSAVQAPAGVELLDDLDITVATLTPPRLATDGDDEIEQETGLVGGRSASEGGGSGEPGASG